jgi:hypothetical protein
MSWGTWMEDRRYPAKDGEHEIVVYRRTDGTGKTYWKNERRKLSRPKFTAADRLYLESREAAAGGGS